MINIALAGVGRIGMVHAESIRIRLPGKARLSLLVDSKSPQLEQIAKGFQRKIH